MAERAAVELQVLVDADEAPLAWGHDADHLVVEVASPAGWLTLLLPMGEARAWAGALFDAVSVAYREATGDPHALTDYELAGLPHPDAYQPAATLHLTGTDQAPARMRFVIALTVQGQSLCDADLRAAIVDTLLTRFNTVRVAVSSGQADDPDV